MRGSVKPALLAAVTTAVLVSALFGVVSTGSSTLEPALGLSIVAFAAVVLVLFGGVFRLSKALP